MLTNFILTHFKPKKLHPMFLNPILLNMSQSLSKITINHGTIGCY